MQFEDDSGRICTIAGPSAHRNPKFGSSCKQLNGWPGSQVSKLASNRRERRSCTLKLAMIPAGICSRLSSLSIHLSTTSPTSEILLPCYVYTVSAILATIRNLFRRSEWGKFLTRVSFYPTN